MNSSRSHILILRIFLTGLSISLVLLCCSPVKAWSIDSDVGRVGEPTEVYGDVTNLDEGLTNGSLNGGRADRSDDTVENMEPVTGSRIEGSLGTDAQPISDSGQNPEGGSEPAAAMMVEGETDGWMEAGNLQYTIDEYGVLTIQGQGAMDDYRNSTSSRAPWFSEAEGIVLVVMKSGITSIGNYAFYDLKNVAGISIPDSVQSIGNAAFRDCSGLTGISIPEGVQSIGESAFRGCSGLTGISIPEGVQSIGNAAFRDCSGLTGISIPEGVQSIGFGVFFGCSGLTGISIPEGVQSIGDSAFNGCSNLKELVIPSSATMFGTAMFADCPSSMILRLPEMSVLPTQLFTGGTNNLSTRLSLEEVWLGDVRIIEDGVLDLSGTEVQNIGSYAFYRIHIEKVIFPQTLTVIGAYAFSGCAELVELDFTRASRLQAIDANAFTSNAFSASGLTALDFSGCFSLTTIAANSFTKNNIVSVTKLSGAALLSAINNSVFNLEAFSDKSARDGFMQIEGLILSVAVEGGGSGSQPNLIIPGWAIGVAPGAFNGNTDIETVVYPEGIETIGNDTFRGSSVETVVLSESITSIGNNAFMGSSIKALTLPKSVKSIGSFAFQGCSALEEINFEEGAELEVLGTNVFQNCTSLNEVNLPPGITVLPASLFSNCTNLTQVGLPSTLKSIGTSGSAGSGAFQNCSKLEELVFPHGFEESMASNVGSSSFFPLRVIFPSTLKKMGFRISNYDKTEHIFINPDPELDFTPPGFQQPPLTDAKSVVIHGDYSEAVKDRILSQLAEPSYLTFDPHKLPSDGRYAIVVDPSNTVTKTIDYDCRYEHCGIEAHDEVSVAPLDTSGTEHAIFASELGTSNQLLRLFDITWTSSSGTAVTEGFGTLSVTVPLGDGYNGRTVSIRGLHGDATISEVVAEGIEVADGSVTFETTELSSFAVILEAEPPEDKVEKAGLSAALKTALSLVADTEVSADGRDIATTDYWVTKADQSKLLAAIGAAQSVLADGSATQAEVDAATASLQKAADAFGVAKKPGMRAAGDDDPPAGDDDPPAGDDDPPAGDDDPPAGNPPSDGAVPDATAKTSSGTANTASGIVKTGDDKVVVAFFSALALIGLAGAFVLRRASTRHQGK